MSNAVLVNYTDGHYQMIGAAMPEDWDEVVNACVAFYKIEDLTGWGEYKEAYKVYSQYKTSVYFVKD